MLSYFVQKVCYNPKNFQFLLILLVITSFGLVIRNSSHWSFNKTYSYNKCFLHEDDYNKNKIISSMCRCGKEIPVPKDLDINSTINDRFHWCSEESSVRGPSQKIVTYALFGNAQNASVFRRYFSLLRNISLTVNKQYPGWIIRIYHDFLEGDEDAQDQLCKVYCRYPNVDLCSVPLLAERIGNEKSPIDPALLRGLNPKMFRYLVMLDPNVDLFISRDVDSIIFRREVDAVEQWLKSNYTFHLMRDHRGHGSIILAGMFGIKVHRRRDLVQGIARALILSGQNRIGHQDQASLDQILWPAAKFDVMAHDSYHCQNEHITRTSPLKVFPFPTQRNGSYYVGGAGHELYPIVCPEACRPPGHKDWEYC